MDIKSQVDTGNFNGLLVISDIHNEYYTAKKAVDIAFEKNLLVVFLGDLLDGGPWPTETLLLVKQIFFAIFPNVDLKHDLFDVSFF